MLAGLSALIAVGCSEGADSSERIDPSDNEAEIETAAAVDCPDGGKPDGSSPDGGKPDGSSPDSGTPTGPLPLPAPEVAGPYQVAKLENVGKGFENPPTAANDKGDGSGCTAFVQSFGETPEAAKAYATFGPDYDVALYTLYYPKNMAPGVRYPILSWANGTCAKTNGYDALLSHLTSQGFIVIAPNSRYTGSGVAQLRGFDFLAAEDKRPDSPLYQHVDADKAGVFGHSQGGGSTWTAAADKRVKTSVVLNAGGAGTRPTPTFFVTGDKDLLPEASFSGARAQTAAAAIRLHKIEGAFPAGHVTLMKEPARVFPSVAAWFRYQLLGDEVGRSWFVGASCKLCNQPEEWEFFTKGLK